jgi:hypothetical protein
MNNQSAIIYYLIHSEEFGANEQAILKKLPLQALPELVEYLNKAENNVAFMRSIYMISEKYKQFEQDLLETEKSQYARALVEGSKRSPRKVVPSNLISLESVKRPEVLEYALAMSKDKDPSVQTLAQNLVEIISNSEDVNAETVNLSSPMMHLKSTRELPSNIAVSPVSWGITIVLLVFIIGLAWWLSNKRRR